MSQAERDAFVAGVKYTIVGPIKPKDWISDAQREALRRYPDETPAPAGPWMCDSCPDTFTSYEDAMNHERRVGEALEAKLKISPLIPYDGTLEAAPAESKTPEDKPEATRRWRCKGCGWEVREAGEEILEEA